MTLHEMIKQTLTTACPTAKGGIFEVFMPFDSRNSTYRLTTPAVIFRFDRLKDQKFGLFQLELRVDIFGKISEVEAVGKEIQDAFAAEVKTGGWSVSLSSGELMETWDTDLKMNWGTMTLKGVAIEGE